MVRGSAPVQNHSSEFPLSANQAALWFVNERAGGSRAYNMSCAVEIAEALDVDALCRSWARLVARHEALRTRFGERRGVPYQEVLVERALDIEHHHVARQTETEMRLKLENEAD